MGLFGETKEVGHVIQLRDDMDALHQAHPIEEGFVVKSKNHVRELAWLYLDKLAKPVYGMGINSNVILVTNRDVIWDIFDELDASWKGDKVKAKMVEIAKEQEHKASGKDTGTMLSKSTLLLSIAALILILTIAFIGVMKIYGH